MSPDDLAAAFDDLARADPEIRIDGTRAADGTVTALLAAGGSHPESWRRFCSHAIDAARLFDPNGQGDPVERWLSLVWKNAPELISGDLLGGMIKDAAGASAIVVRRLRDAVRAVKPVELVTSTPTAGDDAAVRAIAEQQVRGAADRVRDLLSLLTWAYTLSEAGWRHHDRPAGEDVERLYPDGRALYDWLLKEMMGRTGLSRGDLEHASRTRRGSSADELRQLERDDRGYLNWLLGTIRERFPAAAGFLQASPAKDQPKRVTPTEAARLLASAVGIKFGAAKTRITRAVQSKEFVTQGEKGKWRAEEGSFHTWLHRQREEYLGESEDWSRASDG